MGHHRRCFVLSAAVSSKQRLPERLTTARRDMHDDDGDDAALAVHHPLLLPRGSYENGQVRTQEGGRWCPTAPHTANLLPVGGVAEATAVQSTDVADAVAAVARVSAAEDGAVGGPKPSWVRSIAEVAAEIP